MSPIDANAALAADPAGATPKSIGSKVGLYLLTAGLVGVLSLLLLPIEEMAPDTGLPPLALRGVLIIQPAILTLLFVFVGSAISPRLGLQAPLVEAWVQRRPTSPIFRRQIGPAAAGAAAVALVLTAYARLVMPPLLEASEGEALSRLLAKGPSLVTKLLYGGITEELITRWGLVSLLAWIGWRLTHHREAIRPFAFWASIVIAAAIFALAHLPVLFAVFAQPPWWAIVAVLLGNALPGVIFGWLFWKRGIEASMIAHALAHTLATFIQLF